MKHVIRPCARDDIIRQFRWYLIEQDASEAAFRFLDAEIVKPPGPQAAALQPVLSQPGRLANL
jgi:hypothetical protein